MVLEKLKNLKEKKNTKNGGLLGTGLFSKSPEVDFAEAPEAKESPYQGITGGAGFQPSGLERELPDEESRKIYRKELAKQLARERKRQVREMAKRKAKEQAKQTVKNRDISPSLGIVGGGSGEVDLLGSGESEMGRDIVSGEGSSEDEIPII